jgi:mRNA interferase MazF
VYKRGEIVLVPVPFSDLSSSKRRPVLIISNTPHNATNRDMVVVAITSNISQNGIVIGARDLIVGQLPQTSTIRYEKIYTLEQNIVIKQIGMLSKIVVEKVVEKINGLIT